MQPEIGMKPSAGIGRNYCSARVLGGRASGLDIVGADSPGRTATTLGNQQAEDFRLARSERAWQFQVVAPLKRKGVSRET
jgi:hypothetical protein